MCYQATSSNSQAESEGNCLESGGTLFRPTDTITVSIFLNSTLSNEIFFFFSSQKVW